jgi:hypothetical protein
MMVEKKTATASLSLSDSLKRKLLGLAEMEGVTLSEYIENIVSTHVIQKEAEAKLLAQALGININEI